ncbi:MAG: ATP-dependent helicase [Lachnospiraceae bacterium]|nr:ATP-dependent helicase [Lachnospiraceae bacterium]
MDFTRFTEEQKEAITHTQGPMLVLAGPGSGKTTVITERVHYLTEECGVHPGNILVITFTKAAAEEMKERYEAKMSTAKGTVNFGTFHAVFFKILRYAYHYEAANILKEEERYKILREIACARMEQEITDEKELVEAISGEISRVKNERFALESYYSSNCPDEVFREIYTEYDRWLRRENKVDFDDMQLLCYELLSARPDILRQWQQKYTYVLIDEFQDINRVQYDTIRLLAAPEDNLFIVGDDDQSIYRFRGARPELMLHFTEDYPETKQVTLLCNFRSTAPIVQGALRVVGNNSKRFEKALYAKEEQGEAIEFRQYPERKRECAELAEEMAVLHKTGLPWREIAVLYRTNLQTRAIMGKLMEYNIPFKTRDSVPNLYEHWICRDIVTYIKIAQGSRSRGDLLLILNRPKRYIARDALDMATVDFERLKTYYEDKDYVIDRLEKLEYDLQMIKGLNPFAAINYIRRAVGYDGFLTEYARYRKMPSEDLFDLLAELQEDAAEYPTYEAWFAHMAEYTEELQRQKAKEKKNTSDAVTLSTYHSAKGLEYHTVFLPELNEGLTPHRQSMSPEDVEEERRMFYVAMTRAKRRLVLSCMKELRSKELVPSRFVGEVFLDRARLTAGTRVTHTIYGNGVITEATEGKLRILFERFPEEKVLNEAYCVQSGLLKEIIE